MRTEASQPSCQRLGSAWTQTPVMVTQGTCSLTSSLPSMRNENVDLRASSCKPDVKGLPHLQRKSGWLSPSRSRGRFCPWDRRIEKEAVARPVCNSQSKQGGEREGRDSIKQSSRPLITTCPLGHHAGPPGNVEAYSTARGGVPSQQGNSRRQPSPSLATCH